MMLTLSNLFDRSPRSEDYFTNLTTIKLSGECINTRLNAYSPGAGGHAITRLFAGIGLSCPVLEVLDISGAASLSPESLLYLFYRDAYRVLHKYMYLPKFTVDNNGMVSHDDTDLNFDIKKHDGKKYCPWCDDQLFQDGRVRANCQFDVSSPIYVLDDRLYDYIEANEPNPGSLLVHCVKVSNLIRAFDDDVFELQRPAKDKNAAAVESEDDEEAGFVMPSEVVYKKKAEKTIIQSSLCSSLKYLKLPNDAVDSKSWILPLIFSSVPNLKSLGEAEAYEGIKTMIDLKRVRTPAAPLNLEEVSVRLEDSTSYRIQEKIRKNTKTLQSLYPRWSTFCSSSLSPASNNSSDDNEDPAGRSRRQVEATLENWINSDLKSDVIKMQDLRPLCSSWEKQIETLVKTFPHIKRMKISIKPSVLFDNKEIWRPLADGLPALEDMKVHSSCWGDILNLLTVVGHKLTSLQLMFTSTTSLRYDDIKSIEFVNTVPYLCPNLKWLYLGSLQGSRPHCLCSNDLYLDQEVRKNMFPFSLALNV